MNEFTIDPNLIHIVILCLIGIVTSFFYYFVSTKIDIAQKKIVYHFSLFFLLITIACLFRIFKVFFFESFFVLFINIFYLTGVYSMTRGIRIRNGYSCHPLHKDKNLLLILLVICVILRWGVFYNIYDNVAARLFIANTTCAVIILSTLYGGFKKGKSFLNSADKLLLSLVLLVPTFMIGSLILAMFNARLFYILAMPINLVQFFFCALTLVTVILMDNIKLHYENAIKDRMTGLFNRTYFKECVSKRLAEDNSETHGLLFLDIDFFKKVNDVHGHDMGDEVIKSLSKALTEIISTYGIVARFGGEEFAIFLHNKNKEELFTLAENIRQKIEQLPIQCDETTIFVTVSIGVSSLSHSLQLKEGLKLADNSLYKAKESGRNRVC